MKVSVILPTYNEAGNVVLLVNEILKAIPDGFEPEVIVVDDNSTDGTCQLARDAFAGSPLVRVLLRTQDRGLAKSIRHGIEQASGETIVVMDADFTHDPKEIPRLLHVGSMYDIVSGSRFCAGGNMQDKAHYFTSLFYNWILRIILRTQVQDNLGGYFTIKRAKVLPLPLDDIFYGFGEYFFRLLSVAQRRGYSMVEIPAQFTVRPWGSSKSSFLQMLYAYSAAAIRLRLKRLE